jgi:hypothetical protein
VTEKRARKPRPGPRPPEPPEHLAPAVAAVWDEVVAANGIVGPVDRAALEAYCTLTVRMREASKRVADEGMIVRSGTKEVLHPAIALERQLAEQLHALGARFMPVTMPVRRRGPMYDATRRSIKAATHLEGAVFEGARDAVLTLAWLIDEAQRAGLEALQRATFNLIPSYLKACAELQITPASLPVAPAAGRGKGAPSGGNGPGKVSKFSDAAARRRERAGGAAAG